jgi:hypothetical protein
MDRSLFFLEAVPGQMAVHLIQLHGLEATLRSFQLQPVEILGPLAALFQQPLCGAGIDLTDVRRGLDGQALSKALDDPDHGRLGQLAVLQQRALAFTESLVADVAVQTPDRLVLAHLFGDGQVAGPEDIEGWTIRVRAGEERPRPRLGLDSSVL